MGGHDPDNLKAGGLVVLVLLAAIAVSIWVWW